MFLKRRSGGQSNNAIIAQIDAMGASFSRDVVHPQFQTLLSGQKLDMGTTAAAAAGLGAVLDVLEKARRWAAVRIEGRILKKIEAVSPEILFDIEKKLVFTAALTKEAAAYYAFVAELGEALKEAGASGDAETEAGLQALAVKGMLAYLTAIRAIYSDYRSFFGRAVYDRNAEKLTSLTVDDRRAVEGFYSRFDLVVARMERLYEGEIPGAIAADRVSLAQVISWVNGLSECIVGLIESARLILDN